MPLTPDSTQSSDPGRATFSRLRCGLSVALAAALFCPTCREARADAYVSANFIFGEDPGFSRENQGTTHAVVADTTYTDAFTGASAEAFGEVYGYPGTPAQGGMPAQAGFAPNLHASASGHAAQNGDFQGSSGVTAAWNDALHYDDLQISDPGFLDLSTSIYFVGHFDGTISGLASGEAGGEFFVAVSRLVRGQVVTYQQEIFFDHSGSYNQTFRLKLPANALVPGVDVNGQPISAQFSLSLSLGGGSHYDNGHFLGDITSNFSSTAALDTIYLGDDAGNPLPQYADLQVLGNYGAYVTGAPAPEPGTWTLLSMGACAGYLTLRRQLGRA